MYEFKTKPFEHQAALFESTSHLAFWGLLWEQGCGKSKPLIDTASDLFLRGEIDGVFLVAPAGVERNWLTDEIPAHMPDKVRAKLSPFLWETKKAGTKRHAAAFDKMVKVGSLDKPMEERKLVRMMKRTPRGRTYSVQRRRRRLGGGMLIPLVRQATREGSRVRRLCVAPTQNGGQGQALHGVKRDGRQIDRDPEQPVFQPPPRQQNLRRHAGDRVRRVPKGHRRIGPVRHGCPPAERGGQDSGEPR